MHKSRLGVTYPAVAAKTSCLFAFVNNDSAAEKKSVKIKIIAILKAPDFCGLRRATTGAISSATARKVTTRRTKVSIRDLDHRRTKGSSVLARSRGSMKRSCSKVRLRVS